MIDNDSTTPGQRPSLPPGTWVQESESGYRVIFVDYDGEQQDVTNGPFPGAPVRYFAVGPLFGEKGSEQ